MALKTISNLVQHRIETMHSSTSGCALHKNNRIRKTLCCSSSGANGAVHTLDVAIVGGGLGGLAVANGLRNLPYNWNLFEAANEFRTSTSTIAAQGLNSFNALGALDPEIPKMIWSKGIPPRSKVNYRPVGAPPVVEENLESQFQTLIMQWADLQTALAQPLPLERVRWGHRAIGYEENEDGSVSVHFKNQPSIRARLVIGADGVHSAVRATMLPEFRQPRYLGHMNWNALVPMEHCEVFVKEAPANMVLYKNTASYYEPWTTYSMAVACRDNTYFWQVRVRSDVMCLTAPLDVMGRPQLRGPPGCKQRVLDHLAQLGWHDVATLIAATEEADIFERPIVDVPPLPRWSTGSGRVVLLGDAAHAMHTGPGQGSRLAFEDADQLIRAIKAHWPDISKVAQQYQAMRIPRASRISQFAAEASPLPGITSTPTLTLEDRGVRELEFYGWVNQYPRNMFGDPDSRFWKPLVPNP